MKPIQPWSYQRRTSRNLVILLLDTSFSMNGSKLLIAGIAVATLAQLIPSKDLVVIGFSNKPSFIKRFDEDLSSFDLVSIVQTCSQGTNQSCQSITGRWLFNE